MKPLTYVAVDAAAIQHNLRQVRGLLAPETAGAPPTALMAVVKAGGYGHGLTLAARACAEAGADWLGVSLVEEGAALREAGLELPVLVFLPFTEEQVPELIARGLSGTVVGETQLTGLARAARAAGAEAHCHLFVDGGLGRPGVGQGLARLVELAAGFPELVLDGIYTHMDMEQSAVAGGATPLEVVRPGADLRLFVRLAQKAASQQLGHHVPVHAAASAATLLRPETRLDMVRVGTLLYGQYPGAVPAAKQTLDLRPTLELRSTIIGIAELEDGDTVGYGAEFRCTRKTRVGLLPVGYAAGLGTVPESLAKRRWSGLRGWARRALRHGEAESATIGRQRAPILGRIAMDWCCVDVTGVPAAGVGTEVTLPARRLMLDSRLPRVEGEVGK